jgi:hypothetical protein
MFSDDCLKLVRVIGSDIYQFKFVKLLLKLTFIVYLTLLLLQLYYFFQTPSMEDLIKYGPLFLQMCFVICPDQYHTCMQEMISGRLCVRRSLGQKPSGRRYYERHRALGHQFGRKRRQTENS